MVKVSEKVAVYNPHGGGVLSVMAHTFFIYEGVGKSVISVHKKAGNC